MANPEGLISTQEVCARLGVSARTVYRWRDAGRISSVRIGRNDWYDPAEVERVAVHHAAGWYASHNPGADATAPDGGWWGAAEQAALEAAKAAARDAGAAREPAHAAYEAARAAGDHAAAADALVAECDAQAAEIEALLEVQWLARKRSVAVRMDAGEWAQAGSIARDAIEGGGYEGDRAEWLVRALRACNANGGAAS